MEWKKPLEVAVAAAREAGDMLRGEFYRSGGPRGDGEHADIDEPAEWAIRERLREAFPQWSFVGEETGVDTAADEETYWLVDPNDGTSPFLRGFRGSSVSIALIARGMPVLGVVYAPCAPDDDGDLLEWAEGCGPLRRNGREVNSPGWCDAPAVILVSHDADDAAAAYLRCCAPARFRSMPSIAYRLALAAAGDGEAGISLHQPTAWDVAGAHALLRGSGGVLLDEGGAAVTYRSLQDVSQPTFIRRCFGGAAATCQQLWQRDWSAVFDKSDEAKEALPYPVRLLPQKNRFPPGLLRRAQGCMLGQIAGDSLGGLVEFQSALVIAKRYPDGLRDLRDGGGWSTLAGQPTDDSEMALSLARALFLCGGFYDEQAFKAYRQWLYSEPFDVGSTTRQALSSGRTPQTRTASLESQANGSLMRVSSIGVACWHDMDRAFRWTMSDCTLTHPHPACVEACQAYVQAIVAGIKGASPREMHAAAVHHSGLRTREVLEAAVGWPPADYMQHMGWVRIALHNAFYRLLHCDSLEEVVEQTVMSGGDTDTNAAIAGALAGAYFGRDGVPAQWRKMILSCRPHRAHPACSQPRPRFCWPADVLELAERLLDL